MPHHRRTCIALFALSALACALPAQAQDFPNHPIKVIVPQPPGGGCGTITLIG